MPPPARKSKPNRRPLKATASNPYPATRRVLMETIKSADPSIFKINYTKLAKRVIDVFRKPDLDPISNPKHRALHLLHFLFFPISGLRDNTDLSVMNEEEMLISAGMFFEDELVPALQADVKNKAFHERVDDLRGAEELE